MARASEPNGPGKPGPACVLMASRQGQRPVVASDPSPVLELLQPGAFVKLRNQPEDLPPFQLIRCRGGRCWVRQQAWGSLVHWEVAHRQLTAAA
jgi:hypothetical protein